MINVKNFAFVFCALIVCCGLAFGQASMTSTTLSAAVTDTQKSFAVASATGIYAPGLETAQGGIGSSTGGPNQTLLFVDREAMRVTAVSSTTITVQRGVQGTRQTAHVSGAKVFAGPANYFGAVDPIVGTPCTSSLLTVLPRVVIPTGNVFTCGNSLWSSFSPAFPSTVGAVLALSTAGTSIAPTNPIHHVSGTSSGFATITVPPACPYTGCTVTLIPDAVWTSTASGGNIAVATTAVVGKAVIMTYDPGAGKWSPSY